MTAVLRLYSAKKKAKLRSLLSKPLSAIFTLLMVAIYGSMLIPMFTNTQARADQQTYLIYVVLVLGFSLLLNIMMLVQKRSALFFEEDSYYLFIGPFSNRQILSYAIIDSFFQSFLVGLICGVLPVVFLTNMGHIPWALVGLGVLISTLFVFFVVMMIHYFYLTDLVREKTSKRKLIVTGLALIVIALFIGYNMVMTNFNFKEAFLQFISSPAFHYVPLIGWSKAALIAAYNHHYLTFLLNIGLLLLINFLLSHALVTINGYFFEKAMIDAVDFSDYYKKAMAGKTEEKTGNLKDVTITYRQGEGAIFSKNWLILLKSRAFLSKSDITCIIALILFGITLTPNFYIFCGMIIFYLINSIGSSSLTDELKSNYIYLIPGHPLKKLINALIIPIFKSWLFSTLLLLPAFFFLKPGFKELIASLLCIYSLTLIFYAGSVVSVRLLKSHTNQLLESSIRLLVITLTLIPSGLMLWAIISLTGNLNLFIFVPLMILFNLLMAWIIFYSCASMMNGNAYTAD